MDKKHIAKKIAEESIVLLKNNGNVLPFPKGKKVAFFGRAQIGTFYSGNGSGASNVNGAKVILEECEKCGIVPVESLKKFYTEKIASLAVTEKDAFDWSHAKEAVNSGLMYEIFGKYKPPIEELIVPDEILKVSASETETAIFVLGRNSGGEECDRHLDDDYYLTNSERKLLEMLSKNFRDVVVVLNINGLVDLSWTEKYSAIKSVLFLGIPGEEGATALAEILAGIVNPSGKISVSVAERYESYPSANHFSWDKENPEKILDYDSYGLSAKENGSIGFVKSPVAVYAEDIYNGYRYFDTFQKRVIFPFGFGLSYTTFALDDFRLCEDDDSVSLFARVKNIGGFAGKEVIQVYVSKSESDSSNDGEYLEERPYQELKGFYKTKCLEKNESEEIKITVSKNGISIYDEIKSAWMIEKGEYIFRLGTSSRDTSEIGKIKVLENKITQQCEKRLSIKECNIEKIDFLRRQNNTKNDCGTVKDKITSMETDSVPALASFSVEELASLCVGYGPGTPFAAFGDGTDPVTIFYKNGEPITTNNHPTGFMGYVSPAIEKYNISSVFYKDGPAGVGGVSWPTAMLVACSFNEKIWYEFGNAIGEECQERQIDVWLAPGMNIHRNPLCGRNFEYFSEDPLLTGLCATYIAKGVQENHSVIVCPKHFAINEQETYRRGSAKKNYDACDSIITERAAREIYLKPFEILMRNVKIHCIMTSFNKINGTFAGGNKDLCRHILRGEWGFDGAVVTDWGDMDIVVDGGDAVKSGNDIVMPGGPPVIKQILKAYNEGRVTRTDLETAVSHLLSMIRAI